MSYKIYKLFYYCLWVVAAALVISIVLIISESGYSNHKHNDQCADYGLQENTLFRYSNGFCYIKYQNQVWFEIETYKKNKLITAR